MRDEPLESRVRQELASAAQRIAGWVAEDQARLQAEVQAETLSRAELEGEIAELRERLEAAYADARRKTREFEAALDELHQEHAAAMREQAIVFAAQPLDALFGVFDAWAQTTTPAAALSALVAGLGREFSRVILFRRHANRLESLEQVGFRGDGDASRLAVPLGVDSLLTRAATSGRVERFIRGAQDAPVPFAGEPTCAFAAPVVVASRTVAVVYADDADRMESGTLSPAVMLRYGELLVQHARLELLRVYADQKNLAELRDHARLLVQDLEVTYLADVEAQTSDEERLQRLAGSIGHARRVFGAHAANKGADAAALLEEQLRTSAASAGLPAFARDLATLLDGSSDRVPDCVEAAR